MDRLTHHQKILRELLGEYKTLFEDPSGSDVDTELLCDDSHGQYLLLRIGWQGETRIRRTILYVRLRQNQIWIEEDRTKDGLIEDLKAAGISETEIVLAFNPPLVRPHRKAA
jgi:XisI protein